MLKELIAEVTNAAYRYYNYGDSPLSDQEYDSKVALLKKYSKGWKEVVGAPVLNSLPKVKIEDRAMLSLPKTHSSEGVATFLKGEDAIAMVKLDGLTIRLIYENGKFKSANTRGNGTVGTDVTEHVKVFTNVPLEIEPKERVVIDGEAIIKEADFRTLVGFQNPRNTAAGALSLLDINEVAKRKISFIAWDWVAGATSNNFIENIVSLGDIGFETVPVIIVKDLEQTQIEKINALIFSYAEEKGLPCDGVVWKYNDIAYGLAQTGTAHHWGNGIAFKAQDESAWTDLIDIEWSMGRTGVLTPVAVFNPVDLEGTEVERASLHNVKVMRELLGNSPRRGQLIEIIKANQIIPQVRSSLHAENGEEIQMPQYCPVCGNSTFLMEDNLLCENEDCGGKLLNQIDHFCSKRGLDIKGLSKSTLEKLTEWGWVNSIEDIFKLYDHKTEWSRKVGFGPKSVDNILIAINEAKAQPLSKFIVAIGIPLIGNSATKEITSVFPSWEVFRDAIKNNYDFSTLNNFGGAMHDSIVQFDYSEADRIVEKYMQLQEEKPAESSLKGLTVVITGSLKIFENRDKIIEAITAKGGKVSSSVSKNTSILINNDPKSMSSKNKTAIALGIPIVREEDFINDYLSF